LIFSCYLFFFDFILFIIVLYSNNSRGPVKSMNHLDCNTSFENQILKENFGNSNIFPCKIL